MKAPRAIFGIPFRQIRFWGIVSIGVGAAGMFFFDSGGVWRTLVKKKQVEREAVFVDSLANVNRQMRARIEALKANDPKAIEEEARSHGMVKEGEKVYIFKEKSSGGGGR